MTTRRWSDVVAHLIPLTALPSGLWRVALAFGLGVGTVGMAPPVGGERIYIVCLSLVSEGVALLSFGLVRPWGETLPRWLPLVGGRRVPRWFATSVATVGALILAALWTFAFANYFSGHTGLRFSGAGWHALFLACYLPVTLWPPLLLVLTVAYHRRRRVRATPVPVAA
ncbi:MAG TPA: hypothetical protein VGN37_18495 [Actinocatenispora sp.]